MKIGELLKERRIKQGISITKLAELAKVSRPTIYKIEDNANVDLGILANVADALDRQLVIKLKRKG